ncbi:MAG: dihydroneopterin aldolase [Myxococcaceae bacterium]
MAINRIFINDLKISCLIGCYAHERLATRELILNLQLSLSDLKARESDLLADTVDYGALVRFITQKAESTEYFLIEKLAQVLAESCLEFDPRILGVELVLEKPGCIKNAKSASILICLP